MYRKTTIAGLLVGGCCFMAAVPATASASNASQIKKLRHDVKVLSKRLKVQTANFNGFVGCLQFVNLTQYGDGTGGTFGYLYSDNPLDPAATRATTGVDVTLPGDPSAEFLIINPACASGRAARVFGSNIVPQGKLIRAARGD